MVLGANRVGVGRTTGASPSGAGARDELLEREVRQCLCITTLASLIIYPPHPSLHHTRELPQSNNSA